MMNIICKENFSFFYNALFSQNLSQVRVASQNLASARHIVKGRFVKPKSAPPTHTRTRTQCQFLQIFKMKVTACKLDQISPKIALKAEGCEISTNRMEWPFLFSLFDETLHACVAKLLGKHEKNLWILVKLWWWSSDVHSPPSLRWFSPCTTSPSLQSPWIK